MKVRMFLAGVVVAAGLSVTGMAFAATPTLSISSAGGDSANLTISGDANNNATLFFNIGSAYGAQTSVLGTTNGSGQLTKTLSASAIGLNTSNSIYVIVNGQQSSVTSWPTSGSAPAGSVSLNQSNLSLSLSQSTTVVALGNTGVYMMSNSNPSVASAMVNGTQITVTGNAIGSTSIAICYNGTTSNCATLSVTVQSALAAGGGVVTFDNANPSAAVGGTVAVTIMTGGSSFFVSSNSNPTIMTYLLNNNSMVITGVSAGSATISICSATNSTNCGTINVTIGGSTTTTTNNNNTTTNSSAITFSPANPTLGVGQNLTVTLSGGGTTYFVSVNSNPITTMTSTSGNLLTITGVAAGSTSLTVCAAGGVTCGTLPVTVGTTATTPTPAPVAPTPAPVAAPVYAPVPVSTTSGNSAALATTIQLMQAQLSQMLLAIQSMQTQLNQLLATASVGSTGNTNASSVTVTTPAFSGKFVSFLSLNSTGSEVTALQKKLSADGYYSGPITGTFGSLTAEAVKKFQKANGLDPAGYVGPSTRAALNQ